MALLRLLRDNLKQEAHHSMSLVSLDMTQASSNITNAACRQQNKQVHALQQTLGSFNTEQFIEYLWHLIIHKYLMTECSTFTL